MCWELGNLISKSQLLTIISILVEEMVKDLKDANKIRIKNFGEFEIVYLRERQYRNIKTGVVENSLPRRKIKFTISKSLVKFIRNKIESDLKND